MVNYEGLLASHLSINEARRRWLIFWLFSFQYILTYFHRVCPAVLASEFVHTFNISGTVLGVFSSVYFYPYAFMQIPIGTLSDSWGPRKIATIFSVVAGIGSILFGLSMNIGFAIFSRILIGIGVSAIFVPAMKVFGAWFKDREYARITGFFMAIGGVGWLIGTAPLSALSEIFNWRAIFILVGVITLILAVITWIIVRDKPGECDSRATMAKTVAKAEKGEGRLSLILGEKNFWFIAVWFFLRVGILFSFFGLWAGPYLMDTYKLSKYSVGSILAMTPIAIIVGTPLLGYISDNIISSRKKVLVGSSLVLSVCWLSLLFRIDSLSIPGIYILFFIMGMMTGSPASVGFSTIKELFPANLAGTSIGAANFSGFLGGVLFQPFIGYILDNTGKVHGVYTPYAYKIAFCVFFIMSVICLTSIVMTEETLRKEI